ncbi:unnamed protein product [Schistosoma guineensis]|uniref:Antigen Sm21.7 n=4 Tax=Schistosoma TaxID=6181 RepID=A0A094ZLK8_SCHHA|nr:hypothetical protein MS3_00007393 [Schistosoma haematobium]CAH8557953.1 unnamed protein product [Schistosoma mattheei]CAH8566419.1 unnamed protein product [Schistosoma intercalatum]CAH8578425.1 unnamed protein product [Schistosoma guineensis]CAH8582651.1 unnamed protein product [Schistosoma curassoni]KAH9582739.1 hypothetical protein MS3_00007393 [Schistosoma haematobium]
MQTIHKVDGFTEIYFMVDKRKKGWITMPELRKYMEENDVDEKMFERWKTLFDPESTGRITLEKFSEVLGLQEEVINIQTAIQGNEMHDVNVIQSDMNTKMKLTICGLIDEGILIYHDDLKLVEFLKDELDKYFGKLWNVIIIYGRYWSRYCHETGYNFCFIKDDRIFLVYKIPDI